MKFYQPKYLLKEKIGILLKSKKNSHLAIEKDGGASIFFFPRKSTWPFNFSKKVFFLKRVFPFFLGLLKSRKKNLEFFFFFNQAKKNLLF